MSKKGGAVNKGEKNQKNQQDQKKQEVQKTKQEPEKVIDKKDDNSIANPSTDSFPGITGSPTVETSKIFGLDVVRNREMAIEKMKLMLKTEHVPRLNDNTKKAMDMYPSYDDIAYKYERGFEDYKNQDNDRGRFEPFVRELSVLAQKELIPRYCDSVIKSTSQWIADKIFDWLIANIEKGKDGRENISKTAEDSPMIADLYRMYLEADKKCSLEAAEDFILSGDHRRASLPIHDRKLMTEVNRGSWDLWADELEGQQVYECTEKVFARNPKADIKENGLVAIDFGTKSTVVVFNDENYNPMPMNIGEVDRKKEVSLENSNRLYENPTIMHFVNIESFMKEYKKRSGRPYTLWEDINISHEADDKFHESSSSEDFYSYLRDLKQWAGKTTEGIRIRPQNKGDSVSLDEFEKIDLDGFNPIEIYAYYLGLYINRMDMRRIYLDYYLSFPVTYKNEIRRRILESFERGIKKSFPVTILKDEELMKRFRINGDISEPSAYAACALTEYRIKPGQNEEECSYGVFDFGGGTTDFDFGLWKKAEKSKYDYEIVDFEEYAGGKSSLGGENLLKKLAFEVFRDNIKTMREGDYGFTKAPMTIITPDVENCVELSETANRNMCGLMERLRPFWELHSNADDPVFGDKIKTIKGKLKTQDVIDQFVNGFTAGTDPVQEVLDLVEDSEISIPVDLFNRKGERTQSVQLQTSTHKLLKSIVYEINDGIDNFFASFTNSFGVYDKTDDIKSRILHIFLAGNSSKSPIVRMLFEAKMKLIEDHIRQTRQVTFSEPLFVLYPPLGTGAAYEKMEKMGIKVPQGNERLSKPTGKTGVAFGLFACRKGGRIKRSVKRGSETSFGYYIGYSRFNEDIGDYCFRRFENNGDTEKGKPAYNKWYEFIDADDDTFEICCTSLPVADHGNLVVSNNPEIFINRCRLDENDVGDDLVVYIRAIEPTVIEYSVSKSGVLPDGKKHKIYRKELGRNR